MPNWNRFQTIVKRMIETDLGADTCTITIPPDSTYDFGLGEIDSSTGDGSTSSISVALIPTNKDDFDYIPEGFRERQIRKIFSVSPLDRTMKITSDFDDTQFEIIVPSAAFRAGGLTHAYRTFVARIENQVEE